MVTRNTPLQRSHPMIAQSKIIHRARYSIKETVELLTLTLLVTLLLAGCSTPHAPIKDGPPKHPINTHAIQDAQPKFEPYSKYGNPPSYVVFNQRYHTQKSAIGHKETGIASWYGSKFHGRRTSSGETFNMYSMTAAHRTLPLPTYARVTNLENNLSIIVKINDRGPFHDRRIIDLSYAAAAKLGFADKGTARVQLETITFPQHQHDTPPPSQTQTLQHYIQVGAFKNRRHAERLRSKLKAFHPSATVTHKVSQSHSLFRVRLGPFSSRNKATQLASAVDNIGLKAFIVTE